MQESKTHKIGQIILFLSVCMSTAYLTGVSDMITGVSSLDQKKLGLAIPGLLVFGCCLLRIKRSGNCLRELGLNFKGMHYWLMAPLSITAIYLLFMIISLLIHPEMLIKEEDLLDYLISNEFSGNNIWAEMAAIAIINIVLGSLAILPIYIGAELGWRAYFLPQLLRKINKLPTILFGSIAWGTWISLLSFQVYIQAASFSIHIIMVILLTIPLNILFQFFYQKSQSIIPTALAFGTISMLINTSSDIISNSNLEKFFYGPNGFIGILIFWTAGFLLFGRIK